MKRNHICMTTLVTAGCLLCTAPAFSDYPQGRGWQAVKSDFEDIDAELASLGGELDDLDGKLDDVLDAIDGVSDQVDGVSDDVAMVQASLDAEVKLSVEMSTAFAEEGGDGEAVGMIRVEQMAAGVTGLIIDDFGMVSQQIVPAGCTAMSIDELQAHGPDGGYSVRLIPAVAGNTWCEGTYIATMTVDTGLGIGGALVRVEVPTATP